MFRDYAIRWMTTFIIIHLHIHSVRLYYIVLPTYRCWLLLLIQESRRTPLRIAWQNKSTLDTLLHAIPPFVCLRIKLQVFGWPPTATLRR